jgi:hypothetical protein
MFIFPLNILFHISFFTTVLYITFKPVQIVVLYFLTMYHNDFSIDIVGHRLSIGRKKWFLLACHCQEIPSELVRVN